MSCCRCRSQLKLQHGVDLNIQNETQHPISASRNLFTIQSTDSVWWLCAAQPLFSEPAVDAHTKKLLFFCVFTILADAQSEGNLPFVSHSSSFFFYMSGLCTKKIWPLGRDTKSAGKKGGGKKQNTFLFKKESFKHIISVSSRLWAIDFPTDYRHPSLHHHSTVWEAWPPAAHSISSTLYWSDSTLCCCVRLQHGCIII